MSEIQTIEQDLSNFAKNVENDVKIVFKDVVNGASYAETIITDVVNDAIPVTDAVVSILYPSAISYVNVIAQILGDIKAIAENLSNLSAQASSAAQGNTITAAEAQALAKSALTTYNATISSIDNITTQLTPIIKNAIVSIKKNA